MYGLVATKGDSAGTHIQKLGRVACSPNSTLPQLLNLRCDGSHDYTPCAGSNTLSSQACTPSIVEMVHKSPRHCAANKRAAVKVTAAAASAGLDYSGRSVLLIGMEEMEEPAAVAAAPASALELARIGAAAPCPAFTTVVSLVIPEGGGNVITAAPLP